MKIQGKTKKQRPASDVFLDHGEPTMTDDEDDEEDNISNLQPPSSHLSGGSCPPGVSSFPGGSNPPDVSHLPGGSNPPGVSHLHDDVVEDPQASRFDVRKLMTGGIKVEHLQDLKAAAKMLDELRRGHNDNEELLDLTELKLNVSNAKTLEEMVAKLGTSEEALRMMARVVEDRVLEELLTLSAAEDRILLSEFPNSQTQNFFAEVVKLAKRKSPITLSFLLKLITKDNTAEVEPCHVVSVATVFSILCSCVDKSNNALLKINSLQLKMDGITAQW